MIVFVVEARRVFGSPSLEEELAALQTNDFVSMDSIIEFSGRPSEISLRGISMISPTTFFKSILIRVGRLRFSAWLEAEILRSCHT